MRKSFFIFVSNETAEEVNEMSDFAVHVDYDEILKGIQQLQKVDKDFQNKLTTFVRALMEIGRKLKRTSSNETLEQDEAELWKTYQQLQKERLRILDLSHEWNSLRERLGGFSSDLVLLIQNAVDESVDHVTVFVDTLRAHIDILEIKNARRLSLITLAVSVTISYLALWEFFAREFIFTFQFPDGLSPNLNYTLIVISLIPMFWALVVAWRYRVPK
jgi:hypothetical protein